MSSPNPKKRDAQSPLLGDDSDLKRRFVGDSTPILVSLDEISEGDEFSEAENDLTNILKQDRESKPSEDSTMATKVDLLIGRMDKFMNCFATLHSTVTSNQRINDKKFKRLEDAHKDLAITVSSSTASNRSKIESLETQLKGSLSTNAALLKRIT